MSDNGQYGNGGGVYNEGTLTLSYCTVSGNTTWAGQSTPAGSGGGILNAADSNATLTVDHCTLSGNSSFYGGGICVGIDSTATVDDCTLSGNVGCLGGGITNGGVMTLECSTLSANTVSTLYGYCGGGLNNQGTMTVDRSTFSGNIGPLGAGIYNASGAPGSPGILILTDSTIAANSGDGIYNNGNVYGDTLTVINSTISANSGVGIANSIAGNLGTAKLQNTIVAGNEPDVLGPMNSFGNNLIGATDGSSGWITTGANADLTGTSANPLDPLLGPLADNGGPTQTMALLPGSPAIDAGNTALAVDASGQPLQFDQRGPGFARVVGPAVDVGAFEVQVVTPPLTAGALTPPVATEGQAFSNVPVFHFSDADPNGTVSDYTAVVTLGDGNTVTLTGTPGANGQIVANSAGGFDVQLSYTYAEALSNQTFSVTVTDVGGASTSASTSTFNVADAALTAAGTAVSATEGAALTNVQVGTLTDAAGTYSNPSDLSATIDWGDNTTSAATLVEVGTSGVYTVEGSHTYAEYGSYAIVVSYSDEGGSTTTSTSTATVADAP